MMQGNMTMTDFSTPGIPRSQVTRQLANPARWGLTPRQRQAALEFLEEVIGDQTAGTITRIKAVEAMMKADALDLAAQKSMEPIESGSEPQVLLLLPPNGSERPNA